jgi:hypothetical protein
MEPPAKENNAGAAAEQIFSPIAAATEGQQEWRPGIIQISAQSGI